LSSVAANASLYKKQAGGRESCRDQQHREQKPSAKAEARQARTGRAGLSGWGDGFGRRVHGISARTYIPCHAPFGSVPGLKGPFPVFGGV
jgi:hypothetical protein